MTLPWSLSLGGTAESGNARVPVLSEYRRGGEKLEQQWMYSLEQNQLSHGPSEMSFMLLGSFSLSARVQQWLDVVWR